jgi:hypothetical protein
MTSDSGLRSLESDYTSHIQESVSHLLHMEFFTGLYGL